MKKIIYFLLTAITFWACGKKESELSEITPAKFEADWHLINVMYRQDGDNPLQDTLIFITPTTDILLSILEDGRYAAKDTEEILVFDSFYDDTSEVYSKANPDGVGVATSVNKPAGYGIWEFPEKNSMTRIQFDKGMNTAKNFADDKNGLDIEFIFQSSISDNMLTLTSIDYEFMYYYGFLYHLKKYKFNYSIDSDSVGKQAGQLYGYWNAYKHVADSVISDNGFENDELLASDPYIFGKVDGICEAFDKDSSAFEHAKASLPNFAHGFEIGWDLGTEKGKKEALVRIENVLTGENYPNLKLEMYFKKK